MTVKRTSTVLICLTFCAWLSCKKEFDHPPYTPAAESARIGIGELKQRTSASGSIYRFTKGDTNLYCTLISDESSGNFFKQVYAKDDDGGAILLNLLSSGGLYAGDRIRINLNNTNLVCANNMISLDSVNTEKNIVKLSSGNVIAAKPVTIGDILKYIASPADPNNLQSQLVELNGVEFDTASRNKPFGDAIGKTSLNRILTNCAFQQLTLRTSGFADFASRLTPSGSGKITALVSQYGNIVQLTM